MIATESLPLALRARWTRRYRQLVNHVSRTDDTLGAVDGGAVARLVGMSLLAAAIAPLFVVEFMLLGYWHFAAGLTAACVFMVGAPWIYKATGSLAIAREGFLVSLFLFKAWEALFFANIVSPASIWFAAPPIAAILLGNRLSGLFWLVGAVLFLSLLHGYSLDSVVVMGDGPGYPAIMFTFSLVMFCVALVSFVLMVDAGRRRAFQLLLHESNRATALAERDALTGVYNRRYVWQVLQREQRRQSGPPFYGFILLIDIDHFKAINDRYGHVAGDSVLEAVADAIGDMTDEEDCFGRYGGEEFVLLVRHGTRRNAEAFADSIRRRVALLRFDGLADFGPLTVSIGVARLRRGDDPNATLSRVDAALYAAKTAGRNQVIMDRQEAGNVAA